MILMIVLEKSKVRLKTSKAEALEVVEMAIGWWNKVEVVEMVIGWWNTAKLQK